tara:strand:+ start:3916 stop:4218 length:303 start_codon:yes stop_codon:yes gene_type:complete
MSASTTDFIDNAETPAAYSPKTRTGFTVVEHRNMSNYPRPIFRAASELNSHRGAGGPAGPAIPTSPIMALLTEGGDFIMTDNNHYFDAGVLKNYNIQFEE